MTPWLDDGDVRLFHGDCVVVMRELPEASVDAVVCDPPYGLEFMGKTWDRLSRPGIGERPTEWVSFSSTARNAAPNRTCGVCGGRERGARKCGCDQPEWKPIGKRRDPENEALPGDVTGGGMKRQMRAMQEWHAAWAREALRVLKPGGHLLAFGGTRTYHRLACAVEDAGFEIRDTIAWMYGSGFPKSLDVGKAIDRMRDDSQARGDVAEWLRPHVERAGFDVVTRAFGFRDETMVRARWTTRSQPQTPTWEQWTRLRELCGFGDAMDAEVWRLNGRKGKPGDSWELREKVGERGRAGKPPQFMWGDEDGQRWDVTAPATEDAARWEGWGTALKPAYEPVVVARKPLVGTVARNVLEHGVGALNIDACRIESDGEHKRPYQPTNETRQVFGEQRGFQPTNAAGRWPANVVLDEAAAILLDEQSGDRPGASSNSRSPGRNAVYGVQNGDTFAPGYGDRGGASRFFYCAKASRRERGEGNTHPTVKPLALMRWLVRLVTPPGGVVLDPFLGSGTTALACRAERFRCIGIEQDGDYLAIARRRLEEHRVDQLDLLGGAA